MLLTATEQEDRKRIITEGYNQKSLDFAINCARNYAGAKPVFLLSVRENKEYLYAYIII